MRWNLPVSTRLHDDEIPIDSALVRRLVDRQLPQHASLGLHRLEATGSSNALFRLGGDLLVRLPRQPGGSTAIEKEARWLPLVASGLSVSVPRVVAVGEPDLGYPERWSVTTWLEGHPPTVVDGTTPAGPRRELAADLAALVGELRELPVPAEALRSPSLSWYRGGPLGALDGDFRRALDACRHVDALDLDLDAAARVWAAAAAAATGRTGAHWFHGDLLAENLLVEGGRLEAVLDFGGLAVGDPAVDLIAAWEVLGPADRESFRRATGVDDATWLTGAGWALLVAVITFPYYWDTMPARCASRRAMAANVLAGL